ncbi:hypothetical protein Tco_1301561 [Tanacetum coccineum]
MISEFYLVLIAIFFTPLVSCNLPTSCTIKVYAPVGRGVESAQFNIERPKYSVHRDNLLCTIHSDKVKEQKVEAEQPKFTELITSIPTPITTASPESSDAQTGSSFTTSNPDKEEDEGRVSSKEKKNKDPSLPKKKRNAFELEPKTYITGPHCNRALPEGVKFKENKAIEEPKFGLMFMDEFRDPVPISEMW